MAHHVVHGQEVIGIGALADQAEFLVQRPAVSLGQAIGEFPHGRFVDQMFQPGLRFPALGTGSCGYS
jgi:hypothetical protein